MKPTSLVVANVCLRLGFLKLALRILQAVTLCWTLWGCSEMADPATEVCGEAASMDLADMPDLNCGLSLYCKLYGNCSRTWYGSCHAGSDADCQQSWGCASGGACFRSTSPTQNGHCIGPEPGQPCIACQAGTCSVVGTANADRECRATTTAHCELGCAVDGDCAFVDGRCEPATDADCAASLQCSLSGLCARVTYTRGDGSGPYAVCAATTAGHCWESQACREGGSGCMLRPFSPQTTTLINCVTTSGTEDGAIPPDAAVLPPVALPPPTTCKPQRGVPSCPNPWLCADHGLCGWLDGRCVPQGPEDCRRSADCVRYGWCSHVGDRCGASHDDECVRCVATDPKMFYLEDRYCGRIGEAKQGRCVPTADSHCWQTCAVDGCCTAGPTGCYAASAADCERSQNCAQFGECSWNAAMRRCEATSQEACDMPAYTFQLVWCPANLEGLGQCLYSDRTGVWPCVAEMAYWWPP